MTTDDIAYFFDTDTKIDWDQDYISLVTAGNDVLVVSGSKVGIGTSAPDAPLHAYGSVSSNYIGFIDNDGSSNAHGLKVTTDGTGTGTNVLDLESGTTTLFRVRGDGRVGIGKVTALPTAALTVSGTTHGDADIAIASKIQHIGDSDTSIKFGSNEVSFEAGGNTNLQVTDGAVLVNGAFSLPITVIDGVSNVIGSSHHTVLMNASSGHCAAQLPAASGCTGRIYVFKRLDNSANGVKVQSDGSEEIEGSTNDLDIGNQYEVFTLQCDGAKWWIISDNHV